MSNEAGEPYQACKPQAKTLNPQPPPPPPGNLSAIRQE